MSANGMKDFWWFGTSDKEREMVIFFQLHGFPNRGGSFRCFSFG